MKRARSGSTGPRKRFRKLSEAELQQFFADKELLSEVSSVYDELDEAGLCRVKHIRPVVPIGARAPESDEGEAPFVPGPHPVCAKDLEKRVDLREGTCEDRLQINADEGKLGPPKGSAWKRKSVRRSKHADEREDEDCPERWRNGVPGEPKIGQDPEA